MEPKKKMPEFYGPIGCIAIIFIVMLAIGGWKGVFGWACNVISNLIMILLTFAGVPYLFRYIFDTTVSDKPTSTKVMHYILKPIAIIILVILVVVCGYFMLAWFSARQGALFGN